MPLQPWIFRKLPVIGDGSTLGGVGEDYYGVRYTTSQSDPDGERIASSDANMTLHASLPVQSLMKGCLLNDNGTVNYYLDPTDWTKKADGTASNLAGIDGQVMIEVPEHYVREWEDGGYTNIAISLTNFTDATKIDKFYYGAYKAALNRTNNKLGSVVNTSADWRGGNNNAALDAADNTLLGKPATLINRTNFRTYARNRGNNWNIIPYKQYMAIYRLYEVEYATRHSQKAVDGTLTAEGYKKGGLGNGVTTIVSANWNTFNGYYPFVPNGQSDSMGNSSGEVAYSITGWPVVATVNVNRYRGVEMPFGHIGEWVDGINIYNDHIAERFIANMIDDPSNFADNTSDNARAVDLMKLSGYVSKLSLGDKLPIEGGIAGSGTSTYYCDYHYNDYSAVSSYWRALRVGGAATYGGSAGFVLSASNSSAAYTSASFGSRLCYLGA